MHLLVSLSGHPEFGAPLPSITAAVGGRGEFNCDVLSIPPASISWSHDSGGVLTSGGRFTISPTPSITLTITNVQESDEGYYICTAQNSFGRNATSGRLTVGCECVLCNSYIMGARDVWHLLHRSPRAHARGLRSINAMHPECA